MMSATIVGAAASNLSSIAVGSQLYPFARNHLGLGPGGVGTIVGVAGLAAVGATALAGRGDEVRGDVLVAAMAVPSAATVLAGLVPSVATVLLAAASVGAAAMVGMIHLGALRQLQLPPEMQGRAGLLCRVLFSSVLALGQLGAGVVAGRFGSPRMAMALGGIGLLGAGWAAGRGLAAYRAGAAEEL